MFKQALMLLLLAGLIGGAVVLDRWDSFFSVKDEGKEIALQRYGFYLEESAKACGIDFRHRPPTKLDAKLRHILPIVNAMGASVSVVDFDKDGWPDLFVVNSGEGSKCALYRNQHDGTFKDVAEEVGLADLNKEGTGVCMGAVWGDYDNDGYEDVLVYKWGRPLLFHNEQADKDDPKKRKFVDVSEKANLPKWINANSACWLDYDRDGKLDLFIAGYWADDIDLWDLKTSAIMPTNFRFAENGGRKYLLHNNGDGTFADVTKEMGITSTRWTLAVAAADLCGTGYPDLFLANDYGISEVYANHDGKSFKDISVTTNVGKAPKASGMNASFGDVYNSGRLSVYVSNISEPGVLVQGNNLWVPQPGCTGDNLKYDNLANELKVDLGGWSWGAQFVDLNNDGRLDLFLTNGYITADRESYWPAYSLIAGANQTIIQDAKNWPPINGRSLSGYQQKCVWLNKNGTFTDIAPAVGVKELDDGRAVATADLWNRGVQDVIVANQNGPLYIYKNTVTPDNGWVQFQLEGAADDHGRAGANRSAIGAQVRLFWDGQQQVQVVSGGNGYASQCDRRLHFGLGKKKEIDKVVIQWPSGNTQTIERPEAGVLHTILESP
jgi:hypothetical protein